MNAVSASLEALAETVRASTVAVRLGRAGAGSGVIWAADGAIVTNAHVASRPRAEVVLSDGRRFEASVERRDAERDLALLRIEAADLPAAAVRDAADLRPGEVLVAVGHPLGVPNAVVMGIAHARVSPQHRFVQADLRLAPGNSGGPLADARGRVVGINSMVARGVALAVPSAAVERFVRAEPAPARLGVALAPARLRDGRAALVVIGVEPGSRADAAGLRVGDAIAAGDPARLRFATALEVLRAGRPITLAVPAAGSARAA